MSISYEAPRSDARRLQTLAQVITIAAQDALEGRAYIRPDVLAAATTLQEQMEKALDALSDKLAARMQAVSAKDQAIQQLEWHIRDAWESTRRRIRRQGLAASLIVYYGLNESGESPTGVSQSAWLSYGQDVLAGDNEAFTAGFERLREPNQAEIQTAYDAAQKAYNGVPMADRAYDLAQAAVATLRPQADETLADVVRDMRYNLSVAHLDKESERRVMRSYGFTFSSDTATPEETVTETLEEPPTL
ncbi:MAG: hypothetical protein H6662_13265 [Ardenticatenaceae bacterium]|nr:hypothetical protein [Ardenticatenaceae bacterium]